jgi:spore coat polysaccharide biosynthesis protein SpsF (cytidylyltransferase family)
MKKIYGDTLKEIVKSLFNPYQNKSELRAAKSELLKIIGGGSPDDVIYRFVKSERFEDKVLVVSVYGTNPDPNIVSESVRVCL